MKVLVQSQRFDYETLAMDEEEIQAAQEMAAQPDVKEIVADINAESARTVANIRATVDLLIAQIKEQSQARIKEKEIDHQDKMETRKQIGASVLEDKRLSAQKAMKGVPEEKESDADEVLSAIGL